jgi:uncharacterized protein YqeY
MGLVVKVAADLIAAMKARDESRLSVLRMLKAEFQKAQANKGRSSDLTEDEAVGLVRRLVKQRQEAAEQYAAGGYADRAQKELSEVPVLEEYLPPRIGDEELAAMVKAAAEKCGAASPKDMGKLMGSLMSMVAGRADGKRVKELAATYLSSL